MENLVALFKKLNELVSRMPETNSMVILDKDNNNNTHKPPPSRKPQTIRNFDFINYSPRSQMMPAIDPKRNGFAHQSEFLTKDPSIITTSGATGKQYQVVYETGVSKKLQYKCTVCQVRFSTLPQCNKHVCPNGASGYGEYFLNIPE